MSDEVQAAIESSIAGLDSGGGDDAGGSSPVADAPAPSTPPSDSPATESAAPPTDSGQQAAPVVPKRRGPIPYERHESTLAGLRKEHETALEKLRHEHEGAMSNLRAMLDIADQDPRRFLSALIAADPRYAELIGPLLQAHGAGNGNGNGAAPPPVVEMPRPDAQLADGSEGYTFDGLKKLLDWHGQQVESKLSERYKSIEEDHAAHRATMAAAGRVRDRVTAALQWPGFAENQAEIAKALKENPRFSLDDAYRHVVYGKLTKNRDTMRGELIAELNAKPKVVSATTPGGGPPPSADPSSLEDVVKAAIANLPR